MHALLFLLLVGTATSARADHPDRVWSLPEAPDEPEFPLYSGFLQVTEKDVQHNMFYVLCEAIRVKPSEAPLIVWLNGGPGASSMIGFLLENGPYKIDAESGELMYNDFSWNQYANVLYIESPSGVGFSHSNDTENLIHDDNSTATLTRKALQDFMTRIHPRYANRDFYLAGESYAGVYIPYLARDILKHTAIGEFANTNFKGTAMANAGVDDFSNRVAASLHLYSLGVIAEEHGEKLFALWQKILSGEERDDSEVFDIYNSAFTAVGSALYHIPLECNRKENETQWHVENKARNLGCEWPDVIENYMNRKDVQQSLNVLTDHEHAIPWEASSEREYIQDNDTIPLYREIIASAQDGFRILFFTGDMDLMCPPLQTAFAARRISQENNMTAVSSPTNWHYLDDFGGARTTYSTKHQNVTATRHIMMDVVTVRGSGHMVPLTQPDRAFQIINNFIAAEPGTLVDYSKTIPRR